MADPAKTARLILRHSPTPPKLAFVLGSGFNQALTELENAVSIPYAKLVGFPRPSVPGHAGTLTYGTLHNVPILVLRGRSHYYEGHSMETITFPVRVLKACGIEDCILTNAAGSLRTKMKPGDFMIVSDHINFMGANPLRGCPPQEGFVDLTSVYDASLRRLLGRSARQRKLKVHSGTYLAVSGPSFETPAEIKAFARWGADAVGMSTVPEAIVARQCGQFRSGRQRLLRKPDLGWRRSEQ